MCYFKMYIDWGRSVRVRSVTLNYFYNNSPNKKFIWNEKFKSLFAALQKKTFPFPNFFFPVKKQYSSKRSKICTHPNLFFNDTAAGEFVVWPSVAFIFLYTH